jgi:hypothetical protein
MFPRDMVCLRNISVDTLHKGDTEDDDDDDDNDDDNNNNNNNNLSVTYIPSTYFELYKVMIL